MKNDTIDFKSIGQRLRAYRIAASLNAEQIAVALGISRAAVYRLEKGEIVKIETLEKLATLLNTSLLGLLGVDVEYYSNAAGFFERMRQLEESSTHIYAHFDPFSYLLTSERYDSSLELMLSESLSDSEKVHQHIQNMNALSILSQRKKNLSIKSPKIFNLISARHIEKFLHLGLVGSLNIPTGIRMERIVQARKEILHIINAIEEGSSLFEVAITEEATPSLTFQIFYQHTSPVSVAVSPFRLGELPNITTGIATVTNSHQAINSYHRFFNNLWNNSVKNSDAIPLLNNILTRY